MSDVYQDLFQEGSFTGKGIYDVDAFAAAMHDRVPENALLSHDLFEGVFARAGLVTDVELFDEFPSNYLVASAAPASLGARRLAAAAVDPRARGDRRPRPGMAPDRRSRPMEDDRQPPADACRAVGPGDPHRGVDDLAGASADWWTALVVASIVLPPCRCPCSPG